MVYIMNASGASADLNNVPLWQGKGLNSWSGGGTGGSALLDTLLDRQLLTDVQVDEVKNKQISSGQTVEELLVDSAFITKEDLGRLKSELNNIPAIAVDATPVSPEALAFISKPLAERYKILAFSYDRVNNYLSVAMADPLNLETVQFIEKRTRTHLKTFWASEDTLLKVIKERYEDSVNSDVRAILKDEDIMGRKGVTGATKSKILREDPIPNIVNQVLKDAIGSRASDVHIEPLEDRTRIRFRIDGILQERLVLPHAVHDALVSRIKIVSNLKIDEKRLPQDGRFNFKTDDNEIDLRISTLPTVNGEKVVMRLLRKTGGASSLGDLGLRGKALEDLERSIEKPHGIILVTGPTGSGKTTTLYSALTKLNTAKVNIMTLEDPVEYQMAGVNQVQVNAAIGLTFASGLRSFLRQDPNIIMVGEIRDSETAELAIQASLTGHLVLSTLHTNSAAGSLPRLMDMGAETFLLASTMIAIEAQRVVRKICDSCKTPYVPLEPEIENMKDILGSSYPEEGVSQLYKGQGCTECNNGGYLGRTGIYEVLPVTDKIAKMILERKSSAEIEKQAVSEGMITMKQDGYLKVIEGITTIEEVLRVAET